MRLRDVTLTAFGAFSGRALPLAPGLNVVFGPNEAGKSTVHAALYAGLCGHRRGRGVDADQRAFRDRYRPWEGRGWSVAATVELADGRVIELHHDLDGKASSRAIDVALGRDVTDEIRFEGAPDASRWLGLDRRAFLATACVRQADVVSVTEQPGLLSEHLQRAAATAGTDATAAAALERIDQHLREQVGQDRAHSTKPLRRAIDAEAAAPARLARARQPHAANRPPDPPPAPTEHPEDVLRELSFELEHGTDGPEDEDLIARREALSRRLDAASRPLPAGWPLAALLGGPLAAGLIAAVAWRPVALAAAAAPALVLVAGAWVAQLQRRTASLAALHAVEGRLRPAAAHADRARQARDRAVELGLPG